jgi:hypothetical protein
MAMSPELIAILVTALIQLVVENNGIVILGRTERENARMLEHIEGVDAAIILRDRQMKEVLEEVRHLLVTEGSRPRSVLGARSRGNRSQPEAGCRDSSHFVRAWVNE